MAARHSLSDTLNEGAAFIEHQADLIRIEVNFLRQESTLFWRRFFTVGDDAGVLAQVALRNVEDALELLELAEEYEKQAQMLREIARNVGGIGEIVASTIQDPQTLFARPQSHTLFVFEQALRMVNAHLATERALQTQSSTASNDRMIEHGTVNASRTNSTPGMDLEVHEDDVKQETKLKSSDAEKNKNVDDKGDEDLDGNEDEDTIALARMTGVRRDFEGEPTA
ncbi:hypothetical protein PV08_02559 [Exophiala spinifera]|uniref:Uncharacterized protein n=1 Tax=Exophiala spinifera TaxID=91928 RepID=A0A0D1YSM6_9EURO|nr:uncharacterized protein PV08_02559 [Exophiala spinifera]KIW18271.1 hypothetical protein PV08_02559 [Exophiala spinifera]